MENDTNNQSGRWKDTKSHVTAAPESIPGENFDPRIRVELANEPHVVHTTRKDGGHSDEVARRYEESKRHYPELNLSENEFIILDIRRHPIGLFIPVAVTGFLLALLIVLLLYYPAEGTTALGFNVLPYSVILLPVLLVMALVGIGGLVAVWVYLQNHLILTNESVIQRIQYSLFSKHEQTVSLGSIEDASFKQHGIIQMMFNYGLVRLSTEGEETTYRFRFVADPSKQIAVINNAIESFKNGRPIDPYET